MRRSAGHSLGLFAALTLAAEAQAAPQPVPAADTINADTASLADKLETVRALASAAQQQVGRDDGSQLRLLPGMRLAQWFNWGNWRNCANGNC